jgi:bile acid-coenzyme A ligase
VTLQALGEIIRGHAVRQGTAVAVTYPDGILTWAELESRSNRRAHLLRSLGVRGDDLVAITLPNGCEFHEAVVAVWKAGATPCILPAKLPGEETAEIFALARPSVVIGAAPASCGIANLPAGIDLSNADDAPLEIAPATRWKAVASGGSSGRPKIIVDAMPATFDPEKSPYGGMIRPGGAMLNPGPLYHNMPFLFTSIGLLSGAKVVGLARFDAEECLRLVEAHSIEFVAMVPTMMHRIWALPQAVRDRYDLSSLKAVWHMAAPCPQWLKHFWIDWLGPERIFEAYGATESGGCAISGVEWLAKPGSVGKAAPGTFKILRENGETAEAGEVGEVYFPTILANGFDYIGAEKTVDPQFGFSVGDLGYLDEDGYLFLADRRSDMILRGGANIYPAEIEAALDQHPLIFSSAVVGLPDAELGERVHAIVQLQPDARADFGLIAAFLRERLARHKLPASYERVEGELRDEAGKIRRTLLKKERAVWLSEGRDFLTENSAHNGG